MSDFTTLARLNKVEKEITHLKEQEPGGGSGSGINNQVTKLGVTATSDNPYVLDLEIERTIDFKLPAPNVLKFKPGTQNVVSTVCNFDNADATSFEQNEFVKFDGKMQLITIETKEMVKDASFTGNGVLFRLPIDVKRYKQINKIEVL